MKKVFRIIFMIFDILLAPFVILSSVAISWGLLVGLGAIAQMAREEGESMRITEGGAAILFLGPWLFFILVAGVGGILVKIIPLVGKVISR